MLVTTAEAAKLFGVAPGTIRRWASQDRIPGHGTRRHRTWAQGDLQAAYDTRHHNPIVDTTTEQGRTCD